MWSFEFVIDFSQLNKNTSEFINMTTVCSLLLKKKSFNFLIKLFYEFCIIDESMLKYIIIDMLKEIKWVCELLAVTELLKLSFEKIINFSDSLNV